MKERRNWWYTILTVTVVFLACINTSCMSMAVGMIKSMYKDYGVYDKYIPKEELCDFRFVGVSVKSFNGKSVSWGDKANNMGYVKLPAGTHDIVFDWVGEEESKITNSSYDPRSGITTWTTTTTRQAIRNIVIPQITFLPGHKYSLAGTLYNNQFWFFIQDVTNTPSGMFGDEVAKAPKESKTPTELEGTWKASDSTIYKFVGNTWEMDIFQKSYMATPYTPPEGVKAKGTFEINSDKITMYFTQQGINGKKISDISAIEQAAIFTYSFDNENLFLQVEYLFPQTLCVRQ